MDRFIKSIFTGSSKIKIKSDTDKYTFDPLTDFLDEGNYAKIYKAKNKKKQTVILKVLFSESDFRQEVDCNIALQTNLPDACITHFICMLDYFENIQHEDFQYVIVFPYLRNYYSFDQIQDRMTEQQKIKMIIDLTDIVSLLNKTGIVHNDIHFGNIMVRLSPFDVKLIDLGNCLLSDDQSIQDKDKSMIQFFFK
jgi:serine/threonine protein kinase